MRYYLWLGKDGRPISKAWPYEDETERMAEEQRPPNGAVTLRTGTLAELKARYGLTEQDIVAG
jgi:hypothetical protein